MKNPPLGRRGERGKTMQTVLVVIVAAVVAFIVSMAVSMEMGRIVCKYADDTFSDFKKFMKTFVDAINKRINGDKRA